MQDSKNFKGVYNMSAFDFDENLISVSEYEVVGKLPDPFLMNDGRRITSPDEWEKRREEIYKTAIELQYGTQPPAPEVFDLEALDEDRNYRITAGTAEKQAQFMMHVLKPNGEGPFPVIIDGDECFHYCFDTDLVKTVLDNGIAIVLFNRTELAHDIRNEGRRKGQLYGIYPEYTFGALGAWAWGYSRCVDALEKLDGFKMDCIAFTGHSRGAKTAALAGALDKRAAIVNPNETCAGACGCYRIHMRGVKEDGTTLRSERLRDLWKNYGFWMGEGMGDYAEREQDLPFDCHFLKAMVAPRTLLIGEAASDMWANPVGSWQTSVAAKEVFKFLGAEKNLYWYFRRGTHFHTVDDIQMLCNVIRHKAFGEELKGRFFETPFKKPELDFDWKCPETK